MFWLITKKRLVNKISKYRNEMLDNYKQKERNSIKKNRLKSDSFKSCGDPTRTNDLWVMSPTSYQLLHSAMFNGCKGTAFFGINKLFAEYFSIK